MIKMGMSKIMVMINLKTVFFSIQHENSKPSLNKSFTNSKGLHQNNVCER